MITNDQITIDIPNQPGRLWRLTVHASGRDFEFAPPVFEVDGRLVTAMGRLASVGAPVVLPNGVAEYIWDAPIEGHLGLTLRATFRVAPGSPVVRFRYELRADAPVRLTKETGRDNLTYLAVSFGQMHEITEVRLAEFNEMAHSFCLSEREVLPPDFENGQRLIGPILVGSDETSTLLIAYEHGSQVPDAFLSYDLAPDRSAALRAVKGSYCAGRIVDDARPHGTPWLHAAAIDGDADAMAAAYREFILHHMTVNAASRRPDIFYNTWNFQERNKAWYGKAYLDSITQERMLAEIDVAHNMGVDVFVIDTGWYEKTGDWRVNRSRFPDGLRAVKEKLDEYGMTLGLWFNPTVAAVSSQMRRDHDDCLMTIGGKPQDPQPVWESEESQGLCLVSRYWEAFADELIRLHREVGVTYFKWDAIGQYGCDDPGHFHGGPDNTPKERADSYAFQQVDYMSRVVNKLCAACPEAVVDFDITEGGRSVGLSFLAAGKYFLINNGPYNTNYDMPVPADGNVNLFFYPGPARAWICRTPLTYDKWIPSVLFLTHYLPDDIYEKYGWRGSKTVTSDVNQWISLASLVLGHNGIWGDLLSISQAGVARFGEALAVYKQIRDDITAAPLIRTGLPGGSPEIYEKIAPNGQGVVSIFASTAGVYHYITRAIAAPGSWSNDGVAVRMDAEGHAVITATFTEEGAKLVFLREG
ncbi:hypothetical protein CCAX7_000130 [Capsulimonas corticalis]|uniref:Uncharacterized protein n=1 Tax=Capsulimonas corticalis TaxID=2219043 RepID=A0A402CR84_9BACT|nr:alpha-galactosidase [Capsulimonas corticalis]BDI27962.1 hypothetical protein CCAX7_000130 [Capsulimonas corticalis]